LKCPHCGEEILDEDATFCPKCGKSLEIRSSKSSDMVLAAAILTIISAAFSAGLGYVSLYYYAYYYSSEYLIVGILTIVAGAVAIAGALFMFKRKNLIISIIGAIFPLVAVFTPYLVYGQYQFGIIEISMIIFAMLSGIFIFTSRDEFA
jgi:uncharacterized paraquat-inducible protein A